jgi:hypothetical protein
MNRSLSRRRRRLCTACLVFLVGGTIAWIAEQVIVGVPELRILSSKGGFGGSVTTVKKNAKLDVIAREGDWLKVRTPDGREGYIRRVALTARSLQPAANAALVNATSSGADATAASKGALEREAISYASSKGLSTQGVETMIATHLAITAEEFQQFEREGAVGSFKPF